MLLPTGAPATIVARWHAVLTQVLQLAEVKRRFAQAATEPVASASPAGFAGFIAREQVRWGALVQRAGATAE
jgi:tripartite-type tricarboxylate transporter receptor subunit TctC